MMSEEVARTVALAHAVAHYGNKDPDVVLGVAQRYYEFLMGRNASPLE